MEASNELQDWEFLNSGSDSDSTNPFDEIDSVTLVQANYFSLESKNRPFVDDDKSIVSENPSWVDPENSTRFLNKESGEFWTDSNSEKSDFEGRNGMSFADKVDTEVGFKGNDEIAEKEGEIEESGKGYVENSQAVGQENVEINEKTEALGKEQSDEGEKDCGNKESGVIDKRGVVWWKMPIEFVRFCVLRMNPVMTVSIAAAVMGFVILGRRLYTMKKKTRGLHLKVAVDDKKVSQVMSRAARLNEAFSVVKRVPIIRPALPALGSTTWPAMRI